jgi:hypothetical protein
MEQRLKAIETPLARELSEALLMQIDMNASIATMKLWHEKFASSDDEEKRLIAQSLFRDAIVQFAGCFEHSKILDPAAIYGHDPNGLKSYQWFKDTRDAYAAHRFGRQRQCVVGAIINPATGEIGYGHLMTKYAGQNKEDGPQLQGFMQTAAKALDTKVNELTQKLREYIVQLKPEEVSALKDASVQVGLEQDKVRESRSQRSRQ